MSKSPLSARLWKPLDENPLPYAGLATSLTTEHDYDSRIEGKLPAKLSGSLYRNGPGLFDRGDERKRMILDGDGLIQAFHFRGGKVRYLNRFVRTEKFKREEIAGRFTDMTWSTLKAGGFLKNLGGKIANQAGVTVVRRGDKVYAFDEGQKPYELHPETLATMGESILDPEQASLGYNAHFKMDHRNHWFNLSIQYGRKTFARIVEWDAKDRLLKRWRIELPRNVYLHDWGVSENHFVFVLHPAYVPLSRFLKILAGLETFSEAIDWQEKDGNLVLVAPKSGETPRRYETEASWMWHGFNAHEQDGNVVIDFIGSKGFSGIGTAETSPLFNLMKGIDPVIPDTPLNCVRRYVMTPAGQIQASVLADKNNYEMPGISPAASARPHRYGYMTVGRIAKIFWGGIARLDFMTHRLDTFMFDESIFCTEPVFAPAPGATNEEEGWILSEGYNGKTKKSFLAIFDAKKLHSGPVATVHLTHHAPLSFHGHWYGL